MTFDWRLLTDTERLIHRELHRLPRPAAPGTLLPRVMAAVQEWAQRPWYTRAWFSWPAGWQIASSLAFVVFIATVATVLSSPQAASATAALSALIAKAIEPAAPVARFAGLAAETLRVVTTALQPLAVVALPFVLLMGVACVVFATMLNQVVFGKVLHR